MRKAKILAALLLPAFLVAGSEALPVTQPPISSTFNETALSQLYSQSCLMRQDERLPLIRESFDKDTPDYLRAKKGEFFMASTKMTTAQRQKVEELFKILAPHVKELAYMRGVVYVFPRQTMIEALPSLRNDPGYNNDHGLYYQSRVYLPFESAVISVNKDGNVTVIKYTPSTRPQERILYHESGHMADDIFGAYSLDRSGPDGEARLTNRGDYISAYQKDLARLARYRSHYAKDISRLAYYMPKTYNGQHIGGARDSDKDKDQNYRRSRREVFAELWAEANGHSNQRLSKLMPNTYALVKQYNDYLKYLHETAPVKCDYTMDGKAMPKP